MALLPRFFTHYFMVALLGPEIKTLEWQDFQTSDNYIKDFGEFRLCKGYIYGNNSIITQPGSREYLCFQAYGASIHTGRGGLSSCIFTWFLGLFFIHWTVSWGWNIKTSFLKNHSYLLKPFWLIRKALERKKTLLNKKAPICLDPASKCDPCQSAAPTSAQPHNWPRTICWSGSSTQL